MRTVMLRRLVLWQEAWRRHGDALIVLALGLGVFALYVRTMAPSVVSMYDDSLEFHLLAQRFAIAHPTGYPLYTLLIKAMTFLPVGDVAYRVNLASAICASLAIMVLYGVGRLISRGRLGPAAGAALVATSRVFWSQAVVAEVYALNALFVALLLYLALRLEQALPTRRPAWLVVLAATAGLSLTHHRTIILVIGAIALFVTAIMGRVLWQRSLLIRLFIAILLPLTLYLYIPIRGMVTSSLDGTYRNTLAGFLAWVSGQPYTVFLTSNPLQAPPLTLLTYGRLLNDQITPVGILAALGGILALRSRLWAAALLILSGGTVILFAFAYRVPDGEVFLIPSFMVAGVLAGLGLDALRHMATVQWPESLVSWVGALVAVVVPVAVALTNYPQVDMSHEWAVHNYAVDILSQPMEDRAMLVGILGEMTLVRYFQETQGMRADIETVAADTDPARLAIVRSGVAAGRAVYLTRPLPGAESDFALTAVGPLLRVWPRDAVHTQAPAARSPSSFGESIILLGHVTSARPGSRVNEISPAVLRRAATTRSIQAGGRARITLYWQAMAHIPQSYKITLRLMSPSGRLLAQRDSFPVHGGYPTTAWVPGAVIVDSVDLVIPLGTPPGSYDLLLGLYDPQTLRLLPVSSEGGRDNLLAIGPLTVERPTQPENLDHIPRHPRPTPGGLGIPGDIPDPSLEALGISTVVRANFDNELMLYGYGLSETPLTAGTTIGVTLLWQALRRPLADRVVAVQLVSRSDERLWAASEGQPVDGTYPTSMWWRGEVVREQHDLLIPATIPDGLYELRVTVYDPTSGDSLTVLRWTRRSTGYAMLGLIPVQGRRHTFTIPPDIPVRHEAVIGQVARLLGYSLRLGGQSRARAEVDETLPLRPGETVELTLYWQALGDSQVPYTVFTHLLGPDGQIWGQDDSQPGRGAWPTTGWVAGEVLTDTYTLTLALAAPPGEYAIELGFYDATTGLRLPVAGGGDRVLIGRLHVGP